MVLIDDDLHAEVLLHDQSVVGRGLRIVGVVELDSDLPLFGGGHGTHFVHFAGDNEPVAHAEETSGEDTEFGHEWCPFIDVIIGRVIYAKNR